MHAVLISCFSGSIRASSVAEVVLLYSVSNVENNMESFTAKKYSFKKIMKRHAIKHHFYYLLIYEIKDNSDIVPQMLDFILSV